MLRQSDDSHFGKRRFPEGLSHTYTFMVLRVYPAMESQRFHIHVHLTKLKPGLNLNYTCWERFVNSHPPFNILVEICFCSLYNYFGLNLTSAQNIMAKKNSSTLNCCERCQNYWTCETKWYRGENNKENICCPLCMSYGACWSIIPNITPKKQAKS